MGGVRFCFLCDLIHGGRRINKFFTFANLRIYVIMTPVEETSSLVLAIVIIIEDEDHWSVSLCRGGVENETVYIR